MRIGRAVHERDLARQFVDPRMLNALCDDVPPAFEEKGLGGADDDVHGVHLMNDRQQVGLGCDQPSFIVAGPFDQPVDGAR